tara:strand:+ start:321 stop:1388 length:1068 start_codon:yes stop_codon:yes gene_type:complete
MKNYETFPYDIDPSHIPYLKFGSPTPGKTHLIMRQGRGYYFLPNTIPIKTHKLEFPITQYCPEDQHRARGRKTLLSNAGIDWLGKDTDGSTERMIRLNFKEHYSVHTGNLTNYWINNPGSHAGVLDDCRFITEFTKRKRREFGGRIRTNDSFKPNREDPMVKGVKQTRYTGDGWSKFKSGEYLPINRFEGNTLFENEDNEYGLGTIVKLLLPDIKEWKEELYERLYEKHGSTLDHFDDWTSMIDVAFHASRLRMGETFYFSIKDGSFTMRLKEMTWNKTLNEVPGLSQMPNCEFKFGIDDFPSWNSDYRLVISVNKDDRETGNGAPVDYVRFAFINKAPPHQIYCISSPATAAIL